MIGQYTIIDDTLRDGEQQVGVNFSQKNKLNLARKIIKVGIHGITIMPSISVHERKTVSLLIKDGFSENLYAATMLGKEYVDDMIKLGVKKIILFSPMSSILLKTRGISLEENLKKIKDVVIYAKGKGLKIIFAGEDSTRTNRGYLIKVIQSIEKHIDGFLVCDTVGILDPVSTKILISYILKRVKCEIGIHFHNDRGLAVTNSIVAIEEGSKIISGTFGGIGERAGNADIVEILNILRKKGVLMDGIKYNKINTLKEDVYSLGGSRPAKPFRKEAFYHESGIHVSSLVKDPLSYNSFDPQIYGCNNVFFFGKYAGVANYRYLFGNKYSDEELLTIRDYIKTLAYKENRSFNNEEILEIVKKIPLGNSSSYNDVMTGSYFKKNKLNCSKKMFSKKRMHGFFEEIEKYIKKSKKKSISILEIGAGTGFLGESIEKFLNKKGYNPKLYYSDINTEFLRNKPYVFCLDNKNLYKIKDKTFDIVIGGSVLHYEESIQNQNKVIKEVYRVVKNSGLFIYQGMTCNSFQDKSFFSFLGKLAGRKQTLHTFKERMGIFSESLFRPINERRNDFIRHQDEEDYFGRFFGGNCLESIKQKIVNKLKKQKRDCIHFEGNKFSYDISYTLFVLKK